MDPGPLWTFSYEQRNCTSTIVLRLITVLRLHPCPPRHPVRFHNAYGGPPDMRLRSVLRSASPISECNGSTLCMRLPRKSYEVHHPDRVHGDPPALHEYFQ